VGHFYHTYFLPRRFVFDQRVNELSRRVHSGQLAREVAKAEYDLGSAIDLEFLAMVKKRLGYSEERWEKLMAVLHRAILILSPAKGPSNGSGSCLVAIQTGQGA